MNRFLLMALTVSSLLVFICGCKTSSMSNLKPIPIPDGLTDREAVGGAVLATDPTRMPSAWQDMTSIVARYVFVDPYGYSGGFSIRVDPYKNSRWRVEEVSEKYAVLGFTSGAQKHYIRVKYSIEGRNLVPSVLDADNMMLNGSRTRMHSSGIDWINRNIAIIREGMWQVKAIKESAADPDADRRVRKAELMKPRKAEGARE